MTAPLPTGLEAPIFGLGVLCGMLLAKTVLVLAIRMRWTRCLCEDEGP